ncbi:Gp19/Gp15/Gp42 family protein [Humibacter sp. RRB41]|uniref:Gp19/Gp15/Gp42 family protein n=1 Tax=Humibacter sp. RRB41 TaxID=2919946 RepID=UPI001FA96CA0|nr:Gp19/Gp15/Gp42 family protein [Humibacter sp. RRB41]
MDDIPEVSAGDVAARYEGDLDAFSCTYVSTQVQDAVDYALSRWRAEITSRLASGDLTINLYKRVIADAVLRVIRNPQGFSNENDGGYGYGLRAQVASGNLWFTDDDVETLAGPQTKTVPRTMRLGVERGWG